MKRRKITSAAEHAAQGDTSPLRAVASTGISHELRRPNDRLIILKPFAIFPLLGGFTGLAIVVIGLAIYFQSGAAAGLFIGGGGAVFSVAFFLIALASRRFAFDLNCNTLVIARFTSVRRYPIERVRALQLIEGGWYCGGDRPKFFTYQLNVVLDDADRPRINLTNVSNWDATWTMGNELAEFLDVPLLDYVSQK